MSKIHRPAPPFLVRTLAAACLVFSAVSPMAWALSPGATPLSGAAQVIDGDTLDIDGERIRLEGVDAPEMAQTCLREGGATWSCGRDAQKALERMTHGQIVMCDRTGTDKYRRTLALCYADGENLNAALIKAGSPVHSSSIRMPSSRRSKRPRPQGSASGRVRTSRLGSSAPAAGPMHRTTLRPVAPSRATSPARGAFIMSRGARGMTRSRLMRRAASAGSAAKTRRSAPAGGRPSNAECCAHEHGGFVMMAPSPGVFIAESGAANIDAPRGPGHIPGSANPLS